MVTRPNEVNWPLRIKILLILVSVLATLGIGIYNSFFHISNISISGVQRIRESDMRDGLERRLSERILWIFPRKDYFLLDIDDIRDLLLSQYPIKSIAVQKSFPDQLSITIEEKISMLIYDNGKNYSYVDLGGNIVEILMPVSDGEWEVVGGQTSSTTVTENRIHHPDTAAVVAKFGDFPIIFDTRGKDAALNDHVLDKETVKGIMTWFTLVSKNTNIPIKYFKIENELGDMVIETKEGWAVKARIGDNGIIEKEFDELQLVLKSKVKRPHLQYIDVRYNDRVYWQ